MSEKRFVYYEHKGADYILDTPNTKLDFIEMLGDALTSEEIVNTLNEQQSIIEQLKKEIAYHQKKHHTAFMDGRDIAISQMKKALEKIKRYE